MPHIKVQSSHPAEHAPWACARANATIAATRHLVSECSSQPAPQFRDFALDDDHDHGGCDDGICDCGQEDEGDGDYDNDDDGDGDDDGDVDGGDDEDDDLACLCCDGSEKDDDGEEDGAH